MKLSRFAQNRIIICGILIIVQIIIWLMLLQGLLGYAPIFNFIARCISFLAVLYIISKDEETGYKMCWVMLILLMPLFGGVMYVIFGNKMPSKRLKKRFEKQDESVIKETDFDVLDSVDDSVIKSQIKYLLNAGYCAFNKNATKYYNSGESNFDDLLIDLKSAKKFIFMEYFIVQEGYMFDSILEILIDKVKEGVEVRFLYDDVGCLMTLPNGFDKKMQSYGIDCIGFNKLVPFLALVMNNRDHRKITIIDGLIGYTGGINIADEYINKIERFGHWKDTGIRVSGSSVSSLTKMFLSTWNASKNSIENYDKYILNEISISKECGLVVPYGDSPLDHKYIGQDVYLNMINQSRNYIYICTPYLIINETIQTALILASRRGVDVKICTPGIPDKKIVFKVTRSYYGSLIKAGVKIYEYTPGFLHAKNFVCDDLVATVGTVNMDYRSLFLHFECGLYLYNTPTVLEIRNDFLDTISKSCKITINDVENGKFRGLLEATLRVIAPLL